MKLQTTRFGSLEISPEKVLPFKSGLPGFEHLKKFVLIPQGNSGVYFWLQSVDDPDIAFLVTDPFMFFSDYDFELPEPDVLELGLENPEQALILSIITVPSDAIEKTTVNLVAPVVINTLAKKGKQVVLEGTKYGTRHYLFHNAADNTHNTEGRSFCVVQNVLVDNNTY